VANQLNIMSNSEEKNRLQQFREKRAVQNEKVLGLNHLGIKRFFNMDTNTYKEGALDTKTKELLGLVASTVLRCNDCIDYHLEQCAKTGSTKAEIIDAMNVALIVGGSIVIPHLRHAVDTIEMLEEEGSIN
jgi:AhpD family alkylhydroperoxidase